MQIETLIQNLKDRGFAVSHFATGKEAVAYLNREIDHTTVGIGGSMTIRELGLIPELETHNQVFWHWDGETLEHAMSANVYLTSANGVAETGEIINIDGTGNRVAATLFHKDVVYILVGKNKIAEDYDKALWRARNIASPKNAQRLGRKTPCAIRGDRCYDCHSPERICRGLVVLWEPLLGVGKTEVVIIEEALGY